MSAAEAPRMLTGEWGGVLGARGVVHAARFGGDSVTECGMSLDANVLDIRWLAPQELLAASSSNHCSTCVRRGGMDDALIHAQLRVAAPANHEDALKREKELRTLCRLEYEERLNLKASENLKRWCMSVVTRVRIL